jgi:hypothetical protein
MNNTMTAVVHGNKIRLPVVKSPSSWLSHLESLTVEEMVKYSHILWVRGYVRSLKVLNRRDEVDDMAAKGQIRLTGSWLYQPTNGFSRATRTITTWEDYQAYQSKLTEQEKTFIRHRLCGSMPLDRVLEVFDGTIRLVDLLNRPDIEEIASELISIFIDTEVDDRVWKMASGKFPIDLILQHPDHPWNRGGLSRNRNLTFELMVKIDSIPNLAIGDWNVMVVSSHIPLSTSIIQHPQFSDYVWAPQGFSKNPTLTLEIMQILGGPEAMGKTEDDEDNEESDQDDDEDVELAWDWPEISRHIGIDEITNALHLIIDRDTDRDRETGFFVEDLLQRSTSDIEKIFKAIPAATADKFNWTHHRLIKQLYHRLGPVMLHRYHEYRKHDAWWSHVVKLNAVVTVDDLRYMVDASDKLRWGLIPSSSMVDTRTPWVDLDVMTVKP